MISYNSVEGIRKNYLAEGLEGLHRLIEDRRDAGYNRGQRLKEFLILGRWRTDTCGNFGDCTLLDLKYKPLDPAETKRPLPEVMETTEVELKWHGIDGLSTSGQCSAPKPNVHCRECGKGWTLENAHDAFVLSTNHVVDLKSYIGKTFSDVKRDLDAKTDGYYFLTPDLPLRSDRFIDLTPHPKYGGPTNERGWVERTPEKPADWNYVLQEEDHTYAHVVYYTHRKCHGIRKARDSRAFFDEIFRAAGFAHFSLTEIENRYCPCDLCDPWYIAKLPFGEFTVGWRKRVINIDWGAGKDYESLFVGEDVTRWNEGIHAWGKDKAIEYLGKIHEVTK